MGVDPHVVPRPGGPFHPGGERGDPRSGGAARGRGGGGGGGRGRRRPPRRRRRPLQAADHARRGRAVTSRRGPYPQHPRRRAAVPPGHHRRRLRHGHDFRLHHGGRALPGRCDHARDPHGVGRADSGHRQAARDRSCSADTHHRAAHRGGDSRGRSARHCGRGRRPAAPHQGRVADRQGSPRDRHRRPREPGRPAGARDRGRTSGPDPHGTADRSRRARAEMVADARALNSWRRWGYRLLPGDLFSYVLHLRPAEWPIMAGHTLVGYVLAAGFSGLVRGARVWQAIGALVVWVVFLNGGTLAINSVFDKDEGDIGYLNAPPPLPRHLLALSVALLAGGQLLAFALPVAFRIDYAICLVLSSLYSVPPFRFKAVAGVDWVINMWGFGTLTPFAAWAATGRPLDAGLAFVLLGFCPLFAGLYPLTQLYQMEEDRRRGDRTLALLLGLRASLGVAIACTALAFALFGWAAVVLGVRAWLLVVPLVAWVAVLVPWYRRREALPAPAHQRGMYRALAALIVLAAGVAVAFLPARWTAPRSTEGIAGAAAVGLVATVVFSAIDIVLLRPFKAYPWTWDAIGGGSTWWYLPIWWMLGTFLAWMGGIVTAAGGEATLGRRALPALAATVVLALIVRLAGVTLALPVATGGAFTLVLAALALVALARKG